MNDEIIKIKNELLENEREKKYLENKLIMKYYNFFESKGIKRGSIISVKNHKNIEKGIFDTLYIKYGRIIPLIYKIKKDGTAHKSATIYCYEIQDILFDD